MAKKQRGIMGRSDIPLAQRLQMQRNADIVGIRQQSAKAIMFCTSVALHELEGIGYKLLVKFALRFKEINDEFYEDPVVGMVHAKHRMQDMGMPISGELFTVPSGGRNAQLQNHSLQASQIAQICGAIAMNDVLKLGKTRQFRVSERVNELSARYALEGMDFLLEQMRKIGFVVVDGEVRAWLDDDGKPVTQKKAKELGL